MKKIMRIGTVKTWGGRGASVYIKAEIGEGVLSISGVIGPLSSGNALGGCGQIDMEFAHRDSKDNDGRYSEYIKPKDINFASGWNAENWYDLLDVWKEWHLNDMQAGCKHQRKLGWDSYDEHPSEPCPVCGYKYGTAWLKKELPQMVIDFLKALPNTDKQPAWV